MAKIDSDIGKIEAMKSIIGPKIKAVYTVFAPNSLPIKTKERTSKMAFITKIMVPTEIKGINFASTKDRPVIEPTISLLGIKKK